MGKKRTAQSRTLILGLSPSTAARCRGARMSQHSARDIGITKNTDETQVLGNHILILTLIAMNEYSKTSGSNLK